jgi:hypothetical protein
LHTAAKGQRGQYGERTDSPEPRKCEKQTLQHAIDPDQTFTLVACAPFRYYSAGPK